MYASFYPPYVEDCSLLDEDLTEWITSHLGLHIVTNLALEADIGDEALSCLEVNAREVPCIRVSVGVAILYVEEIDEVVPVLDRLLTHDCMDIWLG